MQIDKRRQMILKAIPQRKKTSKKLKQKLLEDIYNRSSSLPQKKYTQTRQKQTSFSKRHPQLKGQSYELTNNRQKHGSSIKQVSQKMQQKQQLINHKVIQRKDRSLPKYLYSQANTFHNQSNLQGQNIKSNDNVKTRVKKFSYKQDKQPIDKQTQKYRLKTLQQILKKKNSKRLIRDSLFNNSSNMRNSPIQNNKLNRGKNKDNKMIGMKYAFENRKFTNLSKYKTSISSKNNLFGSGKLQVQKDCYNSVSRKVSKQNSKTRIRTTDYDNYYPSDSVRQQNQQYKQEQQKYIKDLDLSQYIDAQNNNYKIDNISNNKTSEITNKPGQITNKPGQIKKILTLEDTFNQAYRYLDKYIKSKQWEQNKNKNNYQQCFHENGQQQCLIRQQKYLNRSIKLLKRIQKQTGSLSKKTILLLGLSNYYMQQYNNCIYYLQNVFTQLNYNLLSIDSITNIINNHNNIRNISSNNIKQNNNNPNNNPNNNNNNKQQQIKFISQFYFVLAQSYKYTQNYLCSIKVINQWQINIVNKILKLQYHNNKSLLINQNNTVINKNNTISQLYNYKNYESEQQNNQRKFSHNNNKNIYKSKQLQQQQSYKNINPKKKSYSILRDNSFQKLSKTYFSSTIKQKQKTQNNSLQKQKQSIKYKTQHINNLKPRSKHLSIKTLSDININLNQQKQPTINLSNQSSLLINCSQNNKYIFSKGYLIRARIQYEIKNYHASINDYKKTLLCNQYHLQAGLQLATLYYKIGRKDKSIQFLKSFQYKFNQSHSLLLTQNKQLINQYKLIQLNQSKKQINQSQIKEINQFKIKQIKQSQIKQINQSKIIQINQSKIMEINQGIRQIKYHLAVMLYKSRKYKQSLKQLQQIKKQNKQNKFQSIQGQIYFYTALNIIKLNNIFYDRYINNNKSNNNGNNNDNNNNNGNNNNGNNNNGNNNNNDNIVQQIKQEQQKKSKQIQQVLIMLKRSIDMGRSQFYICGGYFIRIYLLLFKVKHYYGAQYQIDRMIQSISRNQSLNNNLNNNNLNNNYTNNNNINIINNNNINMINKNTNHNNNINNNKVNIINNNNNNKLSTINSNKNTINYYNTINNNNTINYNNNKTNNKYKLDYKLISIQPFNNIINLQDLIKLTNGIICILKLKLYQGLNIITNIQNKLKFNKQILSSTHIICIQNHTLNNYNIQQSYIHINQILKLIYQFKYYALFTMRQYHTAIKCLNKIIHIDYMKSIQPNKNYINIKDNGNQQIIKEQLNKSNNRYEIIKQQDNNNSNNRYEILIQDSDRINYLTLQSLILIQSKKFHQALKILKLIQNQTNLKNKFINNKQKQKINNKYKSNINNSKSNNNKKQKITNNHNRQKSHNSHNRQISDNRQRIDNNMDTISTIIQYNKDLNMFHIIKALCYILLYQYLQSQKYYSSYINNNHHINNNMNNNNNNKKNNNITNNKKQIKISQQYQQQKQSQNTNNYKFSLNQQYNEQNNQQILLVAEDLLSQCLICDKQNFEILYLISVIHYELKRYESSLNYIRQAIQLSDDHMIKHYYLKANTKLLLGKYQQAIKDYSNAITVYKQLQKQFRDNKKQLLDKNNYKIINHIKTNHIIQHNHQLSYSIQQQQNYQIFNYSNINNNNFNQNNNKNNKQNKNNDNILISIYTNRSQCNNEIQNEYYQQQQVMNPQIYLNRAISYLKYSYQLQYQSCRSFQSNNINHNNNNNNNHDNNNNNHDINHDINHNINHNNHNNNLNNNHNNNKNHHNNHIQSSYNKSEQQKHISTRYNEVRQNIINLKSAASQDIKQFFNQIIININKYHPQIINNKNNKTIQHKQQSLNKLHDNIKPSHHHNKPNHNKSISHNNKSIHNNNQSIDNNNQSLSHNNHNTNQNNTYLQQINIKYAPYLLLLLHTSDVQPLLQISKQFAQQFHIKLIHDQQLMIYFYIAKQLNNCLLLMEKIIKKYYLSQKNIKQSSIINNNKHTKNQFNKYNCQINNNKKNISPSKHNQYIEAQPFFKSKKDYKYSKQYNCPQFNTDKYKLKDQLFNINQKINNNNNLNNNKIRQQQQHKKIQQLIFDKKILSALKDSSNNTRQVYQNALVTLLQQDQNIRKINNNNKFQYNNKLLKGTGNIFKYSDIIFYIGVLYYLLQDYQNSIKYLQLSYLLKKKNNQLLSLKHIISTGLISNNNDKNNNEQGQQQQQQRWYGDRICIQHMRQFEQIYDNRIYSKQQMQYNMGVVYLMLGDYNSAYDYLQRYEQFVQLIQDILSHTQQQQQINCHNNLDNMNNMNNKSQNNKNTKNNNKNNKNNQDDKKTLNKLKKLKKQLSQSDQNNNNKNNKNNKNNNKNNKNNKNKNNNNNMNQQQQLDNISIKTKSNNNNQDSQQYQQQQQNNCIDITPFPTHNRLCSIYPKKLLNNKSFYLSFCLPQIQLPLLNLFNYNQIEIASLFKCNNNNQNNNNNQHLQHYQQQNQQNNQYQKQQQNQNQNHNNKSQQYTQDLLNINYTIQQINTSNNTPFNNNNTPFNNNNTPFNNNNTPFNNKNNKNLYNNNNNNLNNNNNNQSHNNNNQQQKFILNKINIISFLNIVSLNDIQMKAIAPWIKKDKQKRCIKFTDNLMNQSFDFNTQNNTQRKYKSSQKNMFINNNQSKQYNIQPIIYNNQINNKQYQNKQKQIKKINNNDNQNDKINKKQTNNNNNNNNNIINQTNNNKNKNQQKQLLYQDNNIIGINNQQYHFIKPQSKFKHKQILIQKHQQKHQQKYKYKQKISKYNNHNKSNTNRYQTIDHNID